MTITHRALCDLGAAWLKRPASRSGPGCIVAFRETGPSGAKELSDAIGWTGYLASIPAASTLVEAKVSRADFLADRDKAFRQNPASGMGDFRYYLAPAGLIQAAELPPQWGLIEYTGRGLSVICGHVLEGLTENADGKFCRDLAKWRFEKNAQAELAFLARMLQRVDDPAGAHERIALAERRADHLARMLDARAAEIRRLQAENLRLSFACGERIPEIGRPNEAAPQRANAARHFQRRLETKIFPQAPRHTP